MSIIDPQAVAATVLAERHRRAREARHARPRTHRPPAEPATGVRRHTAAALRRLATRIEPAREVEASS